MSDVFKEQIVKKIPTTKDFLIKAGLVLLVIVIFFVSATLIPSFAMFIVLAAGVGVYYLFSFFNVEYEYVFTNGELDIDIIYNKNRRKRVFNADIRSIDIMCRIDDNNHIHDFNGAQEIKNYSSGKENENTYAFMTSYKGKRIKVIIEPNEMMINAFSTVLTPRKLIKKV